MDRALPSASTEAGSNPSGQRDRRWLTPGIGALQWVVDSYNFVCAVLLLTGGLLADLYGRRRMFQDISYDRSHNGP